MSINDASDDSPDASHADNDSKRPNLSDLGGDVAHPFDQTNGIVESLEGDDTESSSAGVDDDGDLLVHPTLEDKSENRRSSEEGHA